MTTAHLNLTAQAAAARTAQATAGACATAQTADPLREATVPGPLSALESRVLEQTIPTDPAYAGWFAARLPEAHPFRRFGTIAEARQGLGLITEVVSASLRAGRRNLVAAAALIPIGGFALAYGIASLPEAYAEWRAAGATAEETRQAKEVSERVKRQERILELTTKGIAGWSNPGLEGVTKGFAEAAAATGGGIKEVKVYLSHGIFPIEGLEQAIKEALTIQGRADHYRAVFVIDGAVRDHLLTHDMTRYQTELFDYLMTQVTPGGQIEVAVYLAGDGKTVEALPLAAPVTKNDSGARDPAEDEMATLRSAFTLAIPENTTDTYTTQTLWHTTLDIMAGPNRIPWLSPAPDTVQKVVFITGLETKAHLMYNSGYWYEKEIGHYHPDSNEAPKRDEALREMKKHGIELQPVVVHIVDKIERE